MNSPARVFVDTCVFQLGFPFRPAERVEAVNWGGAEVRVSIPVYEDKTVEGEFLQREVPILPNVAAAANAGQISLFWSDVVRLELFGAPGSSFPSRDAHIFAACPLEEVKAPFLYSVAFGRGFDSTKKQLEAAFSSYPDSELQSLISMLGMSRLLDAVHLVTAARHKMDFMLTTDRKLVEAYRNTKHPLSVSPVFPSELLRSFHETA